MSELRWLAPAALLVLCLGCLTSPGPNGSEADGDPRVGDAGPNGLSIDTDLNNCGRTPCFQESADGFPSCSFENVVFLERQLDLKLAEQPLQVGFQVRSPDHERVNDYRGVFVRFETVAGTDFTMDFTLAPKSVPGHAVRPYVTDASWEDYNDFHVQVDQWTTISLEFDPAPSGARLRLIVGGAQGTVTLPNLTVTTFELGCIEREGNYSGSIELDALQFSLE